MDPITLLVLGGFLGLGTGAFAANQQQQMNSQLMYQQHFYNQAMMRDQYFYNTLSANQQREWSESMMDKQNQFNVNWNTQKNIDDRMREAGRNPFLQNGQTGIVQSSSPAGGSPASVSGQSVGLPSASMPNYSMNSILSALSNAGVVGAQEELMKENARGAAIDNQTRALYNLAEIKKLFGDIKGVDLDNYAKEVANMFAYDMQVQDYERRLQENKNLKLQGASMGYTIAMQQEQLKVLPEQLRLDLCMKNAQLFTEYQRGKLTESQYKHELVKTMLTEEQVKGQQKVNEGQDISNFHAVLDYSTASEIAGDLVRKAKSEADFSEHHSKREFNKIAPTLFQQFGDYAGRGMKDYFGF